MNIPKSSLEPFGVIGIPVIFDAKVVMIIKELNDIFWAMTFGAHIYELDNEVRKERLIELCDGVRTIAIMSGAVDVSVLPVTLQREGRLVGLNFVVEFTASGKRHRHNLRDRNGQ